jgi:prepilin-type N-terminal cleavage/methylation domain-containing protein
MRDIVEYREDGRARSVFRRRGFTLIEVVVASAILLILLIALIGSFSRGVAGFRNAQLTTFAQNLAEFQAEDLKSMSPSVLYLLVQHDYPGKIYEYDDEGNVVVDPVTGLPVLDQSHPLVQYSNYPYAADDLEPWRYDSGEINTEFNIIGLTRILGDPWTAGSASDPDAAPELVGDPILLGANIQILPYEDVDEMGDAFWRYYRAALHRQAFPLFSKRIVVEYYDASQLPSKNDHGGAGSDTAWVGESHAAFDYSITVYYTQGASKRTLYRTTGTITAPYTIGLPTIHVTSPVAGEVWNTSDEYGVAWTVSGDASRVYGYWIYISTDGGATWGAPVATAPAGASAATVTAPNVNTSGGMAKVVAVSSTGFPIAFDESGVFIIGSGTEPPPPGPPAIAITEPLGGATWYVGNPYTVRWVMTGDAAQLPLISEYTVQTSSNGGPWVTSATVLGWTSRSAEVTPLVAGTLAIIVSSRGGLLVESPAVTANVGTASTLSVLRDYSFYETSWPIRASWSWSGSPPVGVTSYTVELIIPGQASSFFTTADATATSYSGFLAPALVNKAGCTVRVTANGVGVHGTSAAFEVLQPVTVNVLTPSNNAVVLAKGDFEVTWVPVDSALASRVAGFVVNVYEGASLSATSVGLATSARSWIWSVPNPKNRTYRVEVVATLVYDARRASPTVSSSVSVKSG